MADLNAGYLVVDKVDGSVASITAIGTSLEMGGGIPGTVGAVVGRNATGDALSPLITPLVVGIDEGKNTLFTATGGGGPGIGGPGRSVGVKCGGIVTAGELVMAR
eukprot:CAMPEP_0170103248 /NCGR_PEP_ID=MMETSP0020_2-20130122/3373_1 /TAXON_ID=98059 /ORGANISM="Dinobryon sp., Strain UTEXLB2267" /LENGTH=104 /DNA_ID=CAMNT_0010326763 /DNA_START=193 /DNA_END=507 /DNA_ORIENTATION=+